SQSRAEGGARGRVAPSGQRPPSRSHLATFRGPWQVTPGGASLASSGACAVAVESHCHTAGGDPRRGDVANRQQLEPFEDGRPGISLQSPTPPATVVTTVQRCNGATLKRPPARGAGGYVRPLRAA